LSGDFDGDGTTDVAARQSNGNWFVGASATGGYVTGYWGWFTDATAWDTIQVGDVNADGKDDLVGFLPDAGQWWAAISTGASFDNVWIVGWSDTVTWVDPLVADFTGDGRVDVAARTEDGQWWLAETSPTASTGTLSTVEYLTSWATDVTWRDVKAADYDGDSDMDIVGRADFANTDFSQWWLAEISGSVGAFSATNSPLTGWVESEGWTTVIADINGDGKDDIVGRTDGGNWWIVRKQGANTLNAFLGSWTPFFTTWDATLVGDVDGDLKDDLIGRRDNGSWLVSRFPTGGPPAAMQQQDNNPANWSAAVDWMFSSFGEDDHLLFD
jgi:hypothetical protein